MLRELSDLEEKSYQENYPVETDNAFIPDEIEAIKEFKANQLKKISKNNSVRKGLEVSFWGILSYSLARFLVLTSGTSGVGLAVATAFFINNIANRDCLDSFNVERKEGQFEITGMGQLLKFALSTLVTAIVIWNATGDLLHMMNTSESNFKALEQKVEEFNRLPSENQNKILIIGGIIIIAGLWVIVDSVSTRRK
ncbi:hypothetical protein SD81_023135 [Tolypothrix campylonemoides VB511288]|nr:hypothetical protein SD81_023135 [Tolypothrix campylonemoides VB511288]